MRRILPLPDYVADLRAPTPSAAAELAVFEVDRVLDMLQNGRELLMRRLQQQIEKKRSFMREYQLRLQNLHPKNQLLQNRQYLTDQEEALERKMQEILPAETAQTGNVCGETGRCFSIKKIAGTVCVSGRFGWKAVAAGS